jgi:intracellular sulfur oxidation DsrE/DsrF family protein
MYWSYYFNLLYKKLIMKRFMVLVLGLLLASLAWGQVKVVYHLSEGTAQASRAIANIRNHLAVDSTVKIVVVAHGTGIDFLLDGATNAKGQAFAGDIGELAGRGVEFRVCNNTLVSRNISKDRVAMEAQIVPSGVVEVARLQAKEGFVYIHP